MEFKYTKLVKDLPFYYQKCLHSSSHHMIIVNESIKFLLYYDNKHYMLDLWAIEYNWGGKEFCLRKGDKPKQMAWLHN